ncbi:MAG TPA: FtsQ-type POTRA domain-containing protein [Bacteroidota bacterium]|nr:FtsQ-type POTRA domain-containing protein [Bacteroidota bacterium]
MSEEGNIEQTAVPAHGKKVYGVFALLTLTGLVMWFGTMQWKEHLTVSGIIVEGEHIVTQEEVVSLAHVSLKTKMYDVDLLSIKKNIEQNHFVKNVIVSRDAPGTIRIAVEERTPIALLALPGKAEMLYIDEEGYVLPHVSSQAIFDLPVISGIDSLADVAVGQRTTHTDVLGALDALETAQRVGSELFRLISEVRIHSGHDMVLYSADTGVPIIFGRGDAAKKMVKLDAFWKKFVAEQSSQDIRYIDIRFDDQVVVSSAKATDAHSIKKSS